MGALTLTMPFLLLTMSEPISEYNPFPRSAVYRFIALAYTCVTVNKILCLQSGVYWVIAGAQR